LKQTKLSEIDKLKREAAKTYVARKNLMKNFTKINSERRRNIFVGH
jgi:hypothetical protein